MKKFLPLLFAAVMGLILFSCTDRNNSDAVDNDTIATVYEVEDTFALKDGRYTISRSFKNPIPNTDVILVYRKAGTDNGTAVWQQVPRTLFLPEGELDYDFDFTKNDVQIYAGGTMDIAVQSQSFKDAYMNKQIFRIVIVPASTGRTSIDYSDYNSVLRFYNINGKDAKSL